MRTRGSARFAPYFKLQWYDLTALAWRDVQQSYATAQEARDATIALTPVADCPRAWRVMAVTMHGRAPLPA